LQRGAVEEHIIVCRLNLVGYGARAEDALQHRPDVDCAACQLPHLVHDDCNRKSGEDAVDVPAAVQLKQLFCRVDVLWNRVPAERKVSKKSIRIETVGKWIFPSAGIRCLRRGILDVPGEYGHALFGYVADDTFSGPIMSPPFYGSTPVSPITGSYLVQED
jgi:hypothetical protein